MLLRPGSLPWLLKHDLRLAWREFRAGFGRLGPKALACVVVLVIGVMHAAVWSIAGSIGAQSSDPALRQEAYADALPLSAFVLLLMLAQALNGATKLLYSRGDLDLILSSPASPRLVLGSRALAVALGALTSAAIFVLPLADAGAAQGYPAMLALYPTLAAGALLVGAIGLAGTLALFRVLGPRRTRLAAQVLATFIGGGFVIALQVRRLLPGLVPQSLMAEGGLPRAALLLPIRAALGEPDALALWCGLALMVFAAAALLLGPAFAQSANAARAVDVGGPRRKVVRSATQAFGRGPLPALRRKEWRLIARDPWVVSQILLQILYMTPLIALLWSGSGSPALAIAPMIAVVTFQVSSSLTWLGLSGEDAPDLLASSPTPAATMRRGKLEAIAALALGLVALPLVYLAWVSPIAALGTAAIAALGLGAAVALQSWHGKPGRRSAFAARHRESKLVALIEMAFSVLFGLGAALAVIGSLWALAALAIVGVILLGLKPRRA
jgi:ABC-2 type transport system permease protein